VKKEEPKAAPKATQQAKKEEKGGTASEPKEAKKSASTQRSARKSSGRTKVASRNGRHRKAGHRGRTCENPGAQVDVPGWYYVKKGDSLWSISERFYGKGNRYKRIYTANRRRLHGSKVIYPCQRVYLPRAPHQATDGIHQSRGRRHAEQPSLPSDEQGFDSG
jgi:nucleoid-associated protein YgaU